MTYWKERKLSAKRKKRIGRLVRECGLLDRRDEINGIRGWNARRQRVHALTHQQRVEKTRLCESHYSSPSSR